MWLQSVKNQELKTATGMASAVGTLMRSGKTPEEFVKSYSKQNSYNNILVALNHFMGYLGQSRLGLKQRWRSPDALIIASKVNGMQRVISKNKEPYCKTY